MRIDGFFEIFRGIRERSLKRTKDGPFTPPEISTEAALDTLSVLGMAATSAALDAELTRRAKLIKGSPAWVSANKKIGEQLRGRDYGG